MAYNNVSFFQAERILSDKEDGNRNVYDRYLKPKE